MNDTTKPKDGGPAYPFARTQHDTLGLSKREWFAGMALAGLRQGYFDNDNEALTDDIAETAYRMADSMIEVGEDKEPKAT